MSETTDRRVPAVSVTIPCYGQLPLARLAVASVLAQDYGDFELTLRDDGASDEYREFAASLGDDRVRYVRNPARLGAMRNMFEAIGAGRGRYSLAFHEDDLLGPRYLSTAVRRLEAEPGCGFVACRLSEFDGEPPAAFATPPGDVRWESCATPADFLRAVFRGVEPMFGSVVYRRAALADAAARHDAFATLVDRPFLLSMLGRWSCAILTDPPMAWYRRHGDGDARHGTMTADHVMRLFETYRAAFPADISREDLDLLHGYAGYWLPALFQMAPRGTQPSLRRFIFRAWRQGLYDPRRGRAFGRKRLLKAMVAGR